MVDTVQICVNIHGHLLSCHVIHSLPRGALGVIHASCYTFDLEVRPKAPFDFALLARQRHGNDGGYGRHVLNGTVIVHGLFVVYFCLLFILSSQQPHLTGGAIHFDQLSIADLTRGFSSSHDRWHSELARKDCGMGKNASAVGNERRHD